MENFRPKTIYIDKEGLIDAVSFDPSLLSYDSKYNLVQQVVSSHGAVQMLYSRNEGLPHSIYTAKDIHAVSVQNRQEQLQYKLLAVSDMRDVVEILVYPSYQPQQQLPSVN